MSTVKPVYLTRKLPMIHKALMLAIVVVPFVSVGVAVWQVWNRYVTWIDILFLVISYIFAAAGVTIGLHRYFTHTSFKANKGVKVVLAFLGSIALEGPIIQWVANHRLHHQLSDRPGDLHSPWIYRLKNMTDEPDNIWQLIFGFFFAHVGWIFSPTVAEPKHYAKDLLNDPLIVWFTKLFPVWVLVSFLLPFLAGGLFALAAGDAFMPSAVRGFLWGGLVRIMLVHHFTWCINSICHIWGEHPYDSGKYDHSGNVAILAWATLGESYHGTHHAFPWSALHGTAWWNDLSYGMITLMAKVGWVSDVKVPTPEQYASKLINPQSV